MHGQPTSLLFVKVRAPLFSRVEHPGRQANYALLQSKELMNRSGSTALLLTKRHFDLLASKRLLIAHDELSLPTASLKCVFAGSAKGHNGIRDIEAKLRSSDFHRLKIGIDRPADKKDVAKWVLGPAMRDEIMALDEEGQTTLAAWQYLVDQGLVMA